MKNKELEENSSAAQPPTHSERLVIDRIEQLKAFANPLRQRIFEHLATAPATTKQVAETLGCPPTRLYHHVATLEKAGLIRQVSTRQVRGATEKYYAAIATTIAIDPALLRAETNELQVVDGIFDNVRAELAELLAGKDPPQLHTSNEIMFAQVAVTASPERIAEFRQRLDELLQELGATQQIRRSTDEDEETYRLLVGWYPKERSTPTS